jgi:hypothetical protein
MTNDFSQNYTALIDMDEEAVLWSATRYQDDNGMVHGRTMEHGTRQLPRPYLENSRKYGIT